MGIDENTISDISYIESIRGNVSFRDMWEFWAKNHKTKRVLTLWDACDEYLRDMRKTEKAKPEHIRHVRRVLEVLVESFGDRLLQDISRKELENWLKSLKFAPVTVKNWRSNITAAWNWFEKNELIEKNIAKGLELPKIEMRDWNTNCGGNGEIVPSK